MVIEGSIFRLRPWREDDAAAVVKYADNRKVWRNLGHRFPNPYTEADAREWLPKAAAAPDTTFAIEVDGEAAGGIGYEVLDGLFPRVGQLGYWLGEPFWGRGIATEAVGLVTASALASRNLLRMQAYVYEWNPASGRVLEKNGYQLEGRLRRAVEKDGAVIDVLLYGYVQSAPSAGDLLKL